jgi:anti-anti-sigma factor
MVSTRERKMTSTDFEVVLPRAGAAVLVLHGEHDLATKESLNEILTPLLDGNDLVVVDLSGVLFIDSSILGELVRADRAARAGGKRFRLQLGTEPIVRRVLEVSGLLDFFDCASTREAALV